MTEPKKTTLGDVPEALMNLYRAQFDLGRDLFESMTGSKLPNFADQARKVGFGALTKTCDIPPPCWMPQPLGECISHVSACKTACVRLVVTNCDRVPRTVGVRATGDAKNVTLTPVSVTIDPMDCKTVEVCMDIPADAETGSKHKAIIWVDGCKLHYLIWHVSVGTVGLDSCHEVEVDDCPDYVHHWYDHFYCVRPCFNKRDSDDSGRVGAASG